MSTIHVWTNRSCYHHSPHGHRKQPIPSVSAPRWYQGDSRQPQNPYGGSGRVRRLFGSSGRVQEVHKRCTPDAHEEQACASLVHLLCTALGWPWPGSERWRGPGRALGSPASQDRPNAIPRSPQSHGRLSRGVRLAPESRPLWYSESPRPRRPRKAAATWN